MPRSKEGKKRPPVDIDAVKLAAADVLDKGMKIRTAARKHGISKTTLDRHLKKNETLVNPQGTFEYIIKNDVRKVFTDKQELELVEYYKQAARLHYGLTKRDALKLAYEYGRANDVKNMPESWENQKSAGFMWLRGLRKRHPSLTLRKPEATSLSRATSFNKENVGLFFRKLKDVLSRYKFNPSKIYNLDEAGNSTVHAPPKIMCDKGAKQVGSVTSGERGANITMIVAVNAIGNHVPPMLVFPRVHFKMHMLNGAPTGSIGGANPSGWSNEKLFIDYLNHFVQFVKPTADDPALLILDNHESHMSIEAIEIAKKNGVVMLTLPPHTSHKLQPLDCTVFGPYKTYYNVALNEWMVEHPGKPITIYDVASVIGKAFVKSFTKENIEKGFLVTGICPLDQNIFGDHEFLSSYVTDRPYEEAAVSVQSTSSVTNAGVSTNPIASSSKSPEIIRPFPKAQPRKAPSRGRQRGKTRILTDTPEKEDIQKMKKNVQANRKRKVLPTKSVAAKKRQQ
ncbi:helix-turn-helix domain-containing protein [Blattabacterium cuenoti]|uniref:helix-turn-helix domain-containing protein n=1 Tax=Blattabacterium cuenoti TaxID=1653831 RepID=UPI00311E9CBA